MLMFTRKAFATLVALLIAAGGILGCETRPDPKEFGDIITEVPPDLDQPFPMPQLETPPDQAKDSKDAGK
jgi:hypothetical protein